MSASAVEAARAPSGTARTAEAARALEQAWRAEAEEREESASASASDDDAAADEAPLLLPLSVCAALADRFPRECPARALAAWRPVGRRVTLLQAMRWIAEQAAAEQPTQPQAQPPQQAQQQESPPPALMQPGEEKQKEEKEMEERETEEQRGPPPAAAAAKNLDAESEAESADLHLARMRGAMDRAAERMLAETERDGDAPAGPPNPDGSSSLNVDATLLARCSAAAVVPANRSITVQIRTRSAVSASALLAMDPQRVLQQLRGVWLHRKIVVRPDAQHWPPPTQAQIDLEAERQMSPEQRAEQEAIRARLADIVEREEEALRQQQERELAASLSEDESVEYINQHAKAAWAQAPPVASPPPLPPGFAELCPWSDEDDSSRDRESNRKGPFYQWRKYWHGQYDAIWVAVPSEAKFRDASLREVDPRLFLPFTLARSALPLVPAQPFVVFEPVSQADFTYEAPIPLEDSELLKLRRSPRRRYRLDRLMFERAEWHKTRVFLAQLDTTPLPSLDSLVVSHWLRQMEKTFFGSESLVEVRAFFRKFTLPSTKADRGLLCFGPPGTGKTSLLIYLAPRCGLQLIHQAVTAGDFMSAYQGDSEHNVRSMFSRPSRTPWLACCLIIDECDSLVPERKTLTGSGSAGAIVNAFIASFGGASDTRNLHLLCATNYLSRIDEAVRRPGRMDAKSFIGLPSAPERIKFFAIKQKKIGTLPEDAAVAMQRMCTNWSGSNMLALVERIDSQRKLKALDEGKEVEWVMANPDRRAISAQELTEACIALARQHQIKVGGLYFPELMASSTLYLLPAHVDVLKKLIPPPLHVPAAAGWLRAGASAAGVREVATGVMLVVHKPVDPLAMEGFLPSSLDPVVLDASRHHPLVLHPTFSRLEVGVRSVFANNGQPSGQSDSTRVLSHHPGSTYFRRLLQAPRGAVLLDVLSSLASLTADPSVDLFTFRLLNARHFAQKGVLEEKELLKSVEEEMEELSRYSRSMCVIDVDSLLVKDVSSEVSHLLTADGSAEQLQEQELKVRHEALLQALLQLAGTDARVDPASGVARFVVLLVQHAELERVVKTQLNWRADEVAQRQAAELAQWRICGRCHGRFTWLSNNSSSCIYHPPLSLRKYRLESPSNPAPARSAGVPGLLQEYVLDRASQPAEYLWRWLDDGAELQWDPVQGMAGGTQRGPHVEAAHGSPMWTAHAQGGSVRYGAGRTGGANGTATGARPRSGVIQAAEVGQPILVQPGVGVRGNTVVPAIS